MNLVFEPICLFRREQYMTLLANTPQKGSDYSFVNLWGWREVYGLQWAFADGLAWIRQTLPEPVCWAPVGDWRAQDWLQLAPVLAGRRFIRVPEQLAEQWLNTLKPTIRESRGHWDYIYRISDLTSLSGPRYAKKIAALEAFAAQHPYDYRPMTPDCVEEALEMQAEWCRWRDCDDSHALVEENSAIVRVLENWDQLPGLMGGTIRIQDGNAKRIVAYTVAEALSADTLVIHFEKAHASLDGAYQAINRDFLRHEAKEFIFVNREQDLDEPGLRRAKLSYNPLNFLQKFEIIFA